MPADPAASIIATIESELGRQITAVFAEFDPEPLACAPIAQVHAICLLGGERAVAKVIRADVEERVAIDLDLLVDRAALDGTAADPDQIAQRGADLYLRMIGRDGFYHADPHWGNVLLMADGRLGVIDCGMVGHIDDQLREDIENALLAIVEDDSRALADVVVRIGAVPPEIDHDGLRRDFAEFIADHVGRSSDDIDVAEAIDGLLDIIHRYQVVLPAPLALLLRVLVMLEGLSRRLNPRFRLADLTETYARAAVARRFSLRGTLRRLRRSQRDWQQLLAVLPRDAGEILRGLRHGAFELHLELRALESTVNRLVQGLISAALFIGSTLLLNQRVPPLMDGMSLFGGLGCLVAIILFIRLFAQIRRMQRGLR